MTAQRRAAAILAHADDAALRQAFNLGVANLVKVVMKNPAGADCIAEMLRGLGWRCTPPAAAAKRKRRAR